MHQSTDIELVSRLCCKRASESDWRRFYEEYQAMIRSWCIGSGVAPSDLDDVFHDILVKLVSGLQKYRRRDGARFRGWLKTVVVNAVTDRLRSAKNNPFPYLLQEVDAVDKVQSASEIDMLAEELVKKTNSAAQILSQVRQRVHDSTWNAFVQRELLQLDAEGIAKELCIKKASVYQSCARVRSIIKQESIRFFGNGS